MRLSVALPVLFCLPATALSNQNQDLSPELNVYFHKNFPDLLADTTVVKARSPNNFYILLRKDLADALVDTTGHLYWFRGQGLSIYGKPFVSDEGFVAFADFVTVRVTACPVGGSSEYCEYSLIALGRDGGFSRPFWHSTRLPTDFWPRDGRTPDETAHLVTGVSPENVFLVYFDEPGNDPSVRGIALDQGVTWSVWVDFVPHRFEFDDDTIVVQGTKTIIRGTAYIDSTVTMRLDQHGRRK